MSNYWIYSISTLFNTTNLSECTVWVIQYVMCYFRAKSEVCGCWFQFSSSHSNSLGIMADLPRSILSGVYNRANNVCIDTLLRKHTNDKDRKKTDKKKPLIKYRKSSIKSWERNELSDKQSTTTAVTDNSYTNRLQIQPAQHYRYIWSKNPIHWHHIWLRILLVIHKYFGEKTILLLSILPDTTTCNKTGELSVTWF